MAAGWDTAGSLNGSEQRVTCEELALLVPPVVFSSLRSGLWPSTLKALKYQRRRKRQSSVRTRRTLTTCLNSFLLPQTSVVLRDVSSVSSN